MYIHTWLWLQGAPLQRCRRDFKNFLTQTIYWTSTNWEGAGASLGRTTPLRKWKSLHRSTWTLHTCSTYMYNKRKGALWGGAITFSYKGLNSPHLSCWLAGLIESGLIDGWRESFFLFVFDHSRISGIFVVPTAWYRIQEKVAQGWEERGVMALALGRVIYVHYCVVSLIGRRRGLVW